MDPNSMNHLPDRGSNSNLGTGGRRPSGRPKNNTYTDLMKPGESWDDLDDAAERRKIQNRLAQRAYRRNMRDRTKEVELLKSQVKELQRTITTTSNGSACDLDERGGRRSTSASAPPTAPASAQASSQASSRGSVSNGDENNATNQEWKGTYFDKWPDTVQPEQDMLEKCLSWPTDLDHELGNCFHEVGEAPSSPPASISASDIAPDMFTSSSSGSSDHAMRWQVPEAHEVFHGLTVDDGMHYAHSLLPQQPNIDTDMMCSLSSTLVEGQRMAFTASPILDCEIDVDEPLIHFAISRGTIDTLRMLLDAYPLSANLKDKAGYTPLQRAVIAGRTDMMALLMKHGADPG